MTVEEMRARLASIDAERNELDNERAVLVVMIEEAEGRPESKRARFERAYLAGDLSVMDAICAQNTADRYQRTGKWDVHQGDAEKILGLGSSSPSPSGD